MVYIVSVFIFVVLLFFLNGIYGFSGSFLGVVFWRLRGNEINNCGFILEVEMESLVLVVVIVVLLLDWFFDVILVVVLVVV